MKETITLKRSILEDGKDLKKVTLDLDRLTGQDMADAEREYLSMGGIPTNMTASVGYQQILAGKACGLDAEVIRRMGAKDATYLTTKVQAFLLDMDLSSPAKS